MHYVGLFLFFFLRSGVLGNVKVTHPRVFPVCGFFNVKSMTHRKRSFSCSCSYTLDATCLEPRAVSMHWPRLKINVKQMLAPHGRTHVCSPPSFDPAVSCFLSENGEMFGFFPWKQEMQGGSPRLTASSPFSKILHSVSAPKGIHGHFYPVNLTRGAAHKLAIRNQYSR